MEMKNHQKIIFKCLFSWITSKQNKNVRKEKIKPEEKTVKIVRFWDVELQKVGDAA